MDGKVVVVTGSCRGVGAAIVMKFAELGCQVVIQGSDQVQLDEVAGACKRISPTNLDPLIIRADLLSDSTLRRLAEEPYHKFGRLDVLVNNFGRFEPSFVYDPPMSRRTYRSCMQANIDQMVLLTTFAVPFLKKSNGCIINMCTTQAYKYVTSGFAYCTAKAAIIAFTKCIAVDLAPKVRVNSVTLGPVGPIEYNFSCDVTDAFTRLISSECLTEKLTTPLEVARVVTFLASPESGYLTGADYLVDGGSLIKPADKMPSSPT